MEHDLMERYIYAVTRRMPAKLRSDVAEELRSLIGDMLEERCGGQPPTEKDLRVVLTELGSPDELYAQYDPNSQKCLIGAPYYSSYTLVLRLVLLCAAFGVSVASVVGWLTAPPAFWGVAALQWLRMLISALLYAFSFVTLLFAIFYRKNIKIDLSTSLDELPLPPKKQAEISRGESIAGIVVSILFATVFLLAPQVLFIVVEQGGAHQMVPVFNAAYVQSHWYILLLLAAVGIIKESMRLVDGRYTLRVMVSTLAANLATAVLSFVWLFGTPVLNPAFPAAVSSLFAGEDAWLASLFTNIPALLLGVVLFALVLDCALTVYKTLRAGLRPA